jgi:V-type H+-transporting ATPase subunit a
LIYIGSISNTASYLRLWALSLAHGQLAKVFFSKCLGSGIEEGSILTLVIGWPVFMHCTLGVLMSMDVMECFLHALRLQWFYFCFFIFSGLSSRINFIKQMELNSIHFPLLRL